MKDKKKSAQPGKAEALAKDKNLLLLSFKDNTEVEIKQHFEPKKIQSEKLRDVYFELGLEKRAVRVDGCGSYLEWHIQENVQKLAHANFCKDRLCPMCGWRRSLKIFGQASQVMNLLESKGYRFLFLTLTVKNCSGEDLGKTLSHMQKAWERMLHRKRLCGLVVGTFRAIEVTYNRETGEFHPHYHIILAVLPDYFHKGYVKQAEWSQIWRECCKLDYQPIIDVRAVTDKNKGVSGAVREIAKYSVKSTDYLQGTWLERSKIVEHLLSSLTQRKLISWTGCFLEAVKQLNLDDVEDGDLVHVDTSELRPDVSYFIVRWQWKAGCYQRGNVERVSPVDG